MKRLAERLCGTWTKNIKLRILLGKNGSLSAGLETIRPGNPYYFDGLRKGIPSTSPIGVFIYTLKGWGILQTPRHTSKILPNHAMIVRVPSQHCYYHSDQCPDWTFFWFVFDNPYVIKRVFANPDFYNRSFYMAEDSRPIQSALKMAENVWSHGDKDLFSLEHALFTWMLEMERWLFDSKHPEKPRQRLIKKIRKTALEHLDHPLGITEVAKEFNMSRSHFSHYFLKTTGLKPAAFIRELRLNEASRLLKNTPFSVKEIAAKTGFFDANHFCKSFSARYHISPGAYHNLYHPFFPKKPL